MDEKVEVNLNENPRERVNILNAHTYAWVASIFRLGYKRDLELEDLYKPLQEHKSNILGDKLSAAWEDELERCNKPHKNKLTKPSLTRALLKVFGARHALNGLILFLAEIFVRLLQPFALGRFLRYFTDDAMSISEAYLYATGIILTTAVYIFFSNLYSMEIYNLGMKLRIACCSLVYRKTLRLSTISLDETIIGRAMNLLSNDVSRFDIFFTGLHYIWVGPLQTIITTYFMYQQVGLAGIYGIIVLLIFIPLQFWLGKKTSILRLHTAIRTDQRVHLTNETIKGIQGIKMYAWEYLFQDIIQNARNSEISIIKCTSYIKSIIKSFSIFIARLSLFITILIYVVTGDIISAEKIFMLTAFYANLRQTMTEFFPHEITHLAEINVTIKRLQEFMAYDEFKSTNLIILKENENEDLAHKDDIKNEIQLKTYITNNNYSKSSVIFNDVYAKWLNSGLKNTLNGINISFETGELVAIIGEVGSGKSSLLNVILRELPVINGDILVPDKISYASQEPWLFSASVRQNILFGRPMDHQKYHRVVEVCQLKHDFTLLPYGDKTLVGERGISLSGGQKARINLARAVYTEASLYLFDDPLSAVDAKVGKRLFEECIGKYLHGRTRVLVTHQIQFLRNADKIIILKDGGIIATGTYDQLTKMGVNIGTFDQQSTHKPEDDSLSLSSNDSCDSIVALSSISSNVTINRNQDEPKEVEETRARGSVNSYIYMSYLKSGGNCCIIIMSLLLCIVTQMSASGADWFLSFWVKLEENDQINRNNNFINGTTSVDTFNAMLSTNMCIYILSGLIMSTIVVSITRSFVFFGICIRASKCLHDGMFRCISRATMYFLNTNTSARILNRFTKDIGLIDELLPLTFIDSIQIGLAVLGIGIVIAISNPWLLIPTIIISIALYVLRIIFVATSRSVKRLEGVTRSPVYNHYSATLQGLTTIRSFEANERLTAEFDRHQDHHSSCWYIFVVTSRAFAFWLDCINLGYTIVVTISFLFFPNNSEFCNGAIVGLAITQCFGLTTELQWGIRQSAELENAMTSVERVLEYTTIESEPPLESQPDKKPLNDWPREAKIQFKNVYLSYGLMGSDVLKNINFTINSQEHVGIVGRTGAGKSSIISALFRLADIRGIIEIDGVDVGGIGLHDLRSKISIIPQEPFLFSGSLRKNIDPFEEYEDNILLAALEDVELKEMKLETDISYGGTNLSVGQRQLVCLARAIVKRNKILVLDEATANVDSRTDELIQITIRRKFAHCTLLTIAHRLNTVMDSDRILVIDAGKVVEFDHPHVLLQNENGYLSTMVKKTGNVMAEMLATIAKENYGKCQASSTTHL